VYFRDRRGQLCRLPASWTDAVEPDPLVVLGADRAAVRIDDMVALLELVATLSRPSAGLSSKRRRNCRVKNALAARDGKADEF
jgi:hypothetical protein